MIYRSRTSSASVWVICCTIMSGCGPSSNGTTPSSVEQPVAAVAEEGLASESSIESEAADFYTVSTYDESFDPSRDLTETLSRAQAEKKRVILQVGGDWCDWCTRISKYMSTNPSVRSYLNEHFLVMKVTYPSDYSEEFLAAYPKCEEYPHFFVLDETGDFLHSQGTGELEKGQGYDDDAFMKFLANWTP